ncbi:hypothetical protein [Streptomyces mobaraensis]|uniref:hypothetical protein n=1 Tax=Streptomyces mobaraensis TaxID=35621 RepID=UPI0012AC8D4E|nr:hypothetical protein [Streptomyces mobaraensis]
MPAAQPTPLTANSQSAESSVRRRRRLKVLLWRAALGAASAAGAGLVTIVVDRISALL